MVGVVAWSALVGDGARVTGLPCIAARVAAPQNQIPGAGGGYGYGPPRARESLCAMSPEDLEKEFAIDCQTWGSSQPSTSPRFTCGISAPTHTDRQTPPCPASGGRLALVRRLTTGDGRTGRRARAGGALRSVGLTVWGPFGDGNRSAPIRHANGKTYANSPLF